MKPDERKRGLRATVETKIRQLMLQKARSFQLLGVSPTGSEVTIVSQKWTIDLLWEIVDSLVDHYHDEMDEDGYFRGPEG